jgi:hypothetical protein
MRSTGRPPPARTRSEIHGLPLCFPNDLRTSPRAPWDVLILVCNFDRAGGRSAMHRGGYRLYDLGENDTHADLQRTGHINASGELLADAEAAEYSIQQILAGERAGDFAEVLLGFAQFLRQQFRGLLLPQQAGAFHDVGAGALQGI